MNRLRFLAIASLLAPLGLSTAARAEGEPAAVVAAPDVAPPPAAPAPVAVAAPPRVARRPGPELNIAQGVRIAGFPGVGYDPFSSNDSIGQLSLAFGPTFLSLGKVSFAALAEWDVGSKRSTARGETSRLAVHRLAVGIESRFEAAERLTLFLKVSPGAYHLRGTIEDAGFERPLVSRSWVYSLDATTGAALMFARVGTRAVPRARFWFTGEAGYAFAGTSPMTFAPTEDADDPRRYGTVKLPDFRPAGPIGRLAFLVSF